MSNCYMGTPREYSFQRRSLWSCSPLVQEEDHYICKIAIVHKYPSRVQPLGMATIIFLCHTEPSHIPRVTSYVSDDPNLRSLYVRPDGH